MTIVLNPYSQMFCYAWEVYSKSLNKIRKWSADYGLRIDQVYLPSTLGSKETASMRWETCLYQVKLGDKYVSEETLATAVEPTAPTGKMISKIQESQDAGNECLLKYKPQER